MGWQCTYCLPLGLCVFAACGNGAQRKWAVGVQALHLSIGQEVPAVGRAKVAGRVPLPHRILKGSLLFPEQVPANISHSH